jgi:hypothetical protein
VIGHGLFHFAKMPGLIKCEVFNIKTLDVLSRFATGEQVQKGLRLDTSNDLLCLLKTWLFV